MAISLDLFLSRISCVIMTVLEIMTEHFLPTTIYREGSKEEMILGLRWDNNLIPFSTSFTSRTIILQYTIKYIRVAFLFGRRKEDTFLNAATNFFTFLTLEAIIF